MWCPNCNERIPDASKFCANCGTQTEEVDAYNAEHDAGCDKPTIHCVNTQKRRILIVSIVSVTAIAIIAIVIISWYFSPVQRFYRYFKADNYTDAALCVLEMSEEDVQKLAQPLYSKAKEVYDAYNQGAISYADAKDIISQLRMIYDTKNQAEIENDLELLFHSKESYSAAQDKSSKVDAIMQYRLVIAEDVLYADAQKILSQLTVEFKQEILQKTETLMNENAYTEAFALLTESLLILTDDADISKQIEYCNSIIAQETIDRALCVAAEYATAGDYEAAIATLKSVTAVHSSITAKIAEYETAYRQVFLDKAAAYANEDKYEDAISSLNSGVKKCGAHSDFAEKLKEYNAAYRRIIFADADQLAENGRYEEAVACLNRGVAYFGKDSNFTEKIAEYTNKFPVHLINLNPCSGKNFATEETHHDIYNNTFEKGLAVWAYNTDYEFEYVADQKYKRFRTTILVGSETDEAVELYIKIYVDNRLAYNSGELTKKNRPIDINIDISGATFIRFEISIEGDPYSFRSGTLLLSAPVFCS